MTGRLERNYQYFIRHFPNFINPDLREMPCTSEVGAVDVCLWEAELPKVGRLDLAFVTKTVVDLVEMKRKVVDKDTLMQARRYAKALKKCYPSHEIRIHLVGTECPDHEQLLDSMDREVEQIHLIDGLDIPFPEQVERCEGCRAGYSVWDRKCPYCEEPSRD